MRPVFVLLSIVLLLAHLADLLFVQFCVALDSQLDELWHVPFFGLVVGLWASKVLLLISILLFAPFLRWSRQALNRASVTIAHQLLFGFFFSIGGHGWQEAGEARQGGVQGSGGY